MMLEGEKGVVERDSTVKGYLLSPRKGREARDTVGLLGSESGRDKCLLLCGEQSCKQCQVSHAPQGLAIRYGTLAIQGFVEAEKH